MDHLELCSGSPVVAAAGVIAETEANSQEDNHTRLSLLSPYSFSDLDALMRFLNLRLK